jgi:hypothetical protein
MTRLMISLLAGLGGVGLLLGGLAWDAWLHAADPTLAGREGIFTLSNPGHLLLAAGVALACGGLFSALHAAWGMASPRGPLAAPAVRHSALAASALASAAAVFFAVSVSAAGHEHGDAAHTHEAVAVTAGDDAPGAAPPQAVVAEGAEHGHAGDHAHAAGEAAVSAAADAMDSEPPDGEAPAHVHEQADAAADGVSASATAQQPHDHPVPTTDELACLRDLTAEARTLTARLAEYTTAVAEGYRAPLRETGNHYANPAYARDGVVFDLAHPETAIYRTLPDGTRVLVGVMYTAPAGEGPTPCGNATWWHTHPQCVDPGARTRTPAPPDGSCADGTVLREGRVEMMHLWFVPRRGIKDAQAMVPAGG